LGDFFTKHLETQVKVSSKLISQFVLHEWDIVECFLILNKYQHLNHHNICQFHVLVEFFIQVNKRIYLFHILESGLKLECSTIIPSPLWDIMSLINEDCIKWCESKKEGTIILERILQTTLKANLIAIKCKRHEPSTIIGFSQYQRYTRLR
jgi:hypothetical protein